MKTKSIFVSLLLLCTGSMSFADYIWNGGSEITSDKWANQGNWELTNGSSWNNAGTGPSTTGSNMWDHVSVSNSNGSISNLEGWTLKLTLVNSNLTVGTIQKFQGDPKYINIDKTSTLTVNSFGGGNDGGNMSINCFGIFNLALARSMGGGTKNLSLGESGIMNFTSANANSHSINNLAINFTLSPTIADPTGGGYSIVTRQLVSFDQVTLADSNVTYTINNEGFMSVSSLDDLTASADGLNKYFISKTESGITVSWVATNTIPEPSTSILGILGLGALCLRRKRS